MERRVPVLDDAIVDLDIRDERLSLEGPPELLADVVVIAVDVEDALAQDLPRLEADRLEASALR